MTTRAPICHDGSGQAPSPRHLLRAGPLSALYEAGELRYVRLGEREVIRRWHTSVRDQNWGTIPSRVLREQLDVRDDSFHIEVDAENRRGAIDFAWTGVITGSADGTVNFRMEGLARSTFLRNRLGFCVLHPILECAGARCKFKTGEGAAEEGRFPSLVAPENPFRELRTFAHEVLPGVWAELAFEGDLFEMEDQRNWTDASFKTFCTPLRLPFPVEVAAGTAVRQAVTLRLRGHVPAVSTRPAAQAVTVGSGPVATLPQVGLARSGIAPSPNGERLLRALGLAHLRTEVHLAAPEWPAEWEQAVAEATALGVPLEAALFVTDEAERQLAAFAARLRPDTHVCRWLIHHENRWACAPEAVTGARRHLAGHAGGTPIVSGTHGNFAELNRARPPIALLDGVCYSAQPQEHASDNTSLMETPAALADTVRTAREFSGGLPVIVSPITLRKRLNPYATGPAPEPDASALPPRVDARQMSLFGACWTLATLKNLAEPGAAAATFYETTGWLGVLERDEGSPLPHLFASRPGMAFPLYHVLADANEFAGAEVLPCDSSHPLLFAALALRADPRVRVLLANLTPEPVHLTIQGLGTHVGIRTLDETSFERATSDPESFREGAGSAHAAVDGALDVTLLPYAYMRLDSA